MTKIFFGRSEDGQFTSVDLQGHAGFADEGEDIVCAAITSSIQLSHVMLEDILGVAFDAEVDPKTIHIRFSFPPASLQSAQGVCQALFIHFKEMQESYPAFVQVTEVHSHAEN